MAPLTDETREVDIEDALRSSKTTLCLRRELKAAVRAPGIHILLSRWTDDATHGIFKPIWRKMCRAAGVALNWYGEEHYDELANGARVYIRGLKTADQTNNGGCPFECGSPLPVVVTPWSGERCDAERGGPHPARAGGRLGFRPLGGRVHDEGPVGDRLNLNGLFEQMPEEQPPKLGATQVEPERELVEVPLEVVRLYGSVVGPQRSSLHEAGDAVYPRQHHECLNVGISNCEGPVHVVVANGGQVRHESIGDDDRARLHRVEPKRP